MKKTDCHDDQSVEKGKCQRIWEMYCLQKSICKKTIYYRSVKTPQLCCGGGAFFKMLVIVYGKPAKHLFHTALAHIFQYHFMLLDAFLTVRQTVLIVVQYHQIKNILNSFINGKKIAVFRGENNTFVK